MSIYQILMKLKETSSINEKQNILQAEKNNENLMLFFKYALHPNMKFGIKKLPERQNDCLDFTGDWFKVCLGLLNKLMNREITGNEAISSVSKLMSCLNDEQAYVFSCMLQKNPRCGVSVAIINRIWDNLIPVSIKLCKAQAYSKKAMDFIKYPAVSQRKCDGERCLAFKEGNNVTFYSSGNIAYTHMNYLVPDILLFGDDDFILDGELLVSDDDGKILPRKIGNGILNKSLKNTITEEEASKIRMVIWDKISYQEYITDSATQKYKDTLRELENICDTYHPERISVVESEIVNTQEEAYSHFRKMLERGEEGTILKNLDMKWEGKRSKNCVKMKIVIETTLEITDIFEGNEKYTGKLGGFICKSSDGKVVVKVGSGFSDSDRVLMYDENMISKYIEIKSNGIIQEANGSYSLFLPRYAGLRMDKTQADTFEDILSLSDGSKMLIGE